MKIQFVYGKLDLQKLPDIDAIVCPTDTHCSGSGGLDEAIHHAAGPDLRMALKDKRLPACGVCATCGFNLSAKHILHAAVPKADSSTSRALQDCYQNVLTAIGTPHSKTPCKSAAITLLGTGFCGWSYEQSMSALWSAVLEYHRQHGSSYFSKGTLETLYVYYPNDASKVICSYEYRVSQAFFNAPDQWGYRGDPYLWYALMEHFDDPRFIHISLQDFIREIQRYFHEKTGKWLCGDTNTYVEEWAHGGMSSGGISGFIALIGIPLLCSNLCKLNLGNQSSSSPSFILPVTLHHTTDYQLSLPYELLPELTVLRQKSHELIQQKKICLDPSQLYFLTTHHYPNAPELVDFYSLDVEKAEDSHYQFTVEAAAGICQQLGYSPNALGAALGNYLKLHGGPALEALIRKFADKEFHYD